MFGIWQHVEDEGRTKVLPVLEGTIARRVLLNFRADPRVVQRLVPAPFEVEEHEGSAIVGICLIGLEEIRPRGFPSQAGFWSENMAHRVAVRYPTVGGMKRAVFIWRRETDQKLVQMFGGRLFPGVHSRARFCINESAEALEMKVESVDGQTDVSFSAALGADWRETRAFKSLDEASRFFQGGDSGFSCSRGRRSVEGMQFVEGMQLKMLRWQVTQLVVRLDKAAFYFNQQRFPKGSIEFDCGLIMRSVPHEWREIKQVPALDIGSLARLETTWPKQ